jgi:2-polyprenyl-3-methyl-5-hydroxy-6-metoxy-1,4-benzoquinol methylase
LSCPPRSSLVTADGALSESLRIILDVSVMRGRIGVGWTSPDGKSFVVERFTSRSQCRISFLLRAGERVGKLIFRNADPSSTPSEFTITHARVEPIAANERTYPVSLAVRELSDEAPPADGGTLTVFDTDAALAINAARQKWLESADLPIAGRRVLDVGCGIGHFVPFYLERGCDVTAIDGRPENIAELRRRHPRAHAEVADVQSLDPASVGEFDVIHCFGLLYHLDSPVAALRHLRAMCGGLMVLETMVCDSSKPVAVLVDETKAASQALDGMGSRPSPSFLALALNRVGFDYVYGAAQPPEHPDFQFDWRDNLETSRNGVPLRCVIVASTSPLELRSLVPLLES